MYSKFTRAALLLPGAAAILVSADADAATNPTTTVYTDVTVGSGTNNPSLTFTKVASAGAVVCSPTTTSAPGLTYPTLTTTCTATPSAGYNFTGPTASWGLIKSQVWTYPSGSGSPRTFTVAGSQSIVAFFEANTYSISANVSPAGAGTAVCNPTSVSYQGTSTCTATAASGFKFTRWLGACQTQGETCTLNTITENQDSTAEFVSIIEGAYWNQCKQAVKNGC